MNRKIQIRQPAWLQLITRLASVLIAAAIGMSGGIAGTADAMEDMHITRIVLNCVQEKSDNDFQASFSDATCRSLVDQLAKAHGKPVELVGTERFSDLDLPGGETGVVIIQLAVKLSNEHLGKGSLTHALAENWSQSDLRQTVELSVGSTDRELSVDSAKLLVKSLLLESGLSN